MNKLDISPGEPKQLAIYGASPCAFISQFLFHTRPSSSHQTWLTGKSPHSSMVDFPAIFWVPEGFLFHIRTMTPGSTVNFRKAMGKAVRNMIYIHSGVAASMLLCRRVSFFNELVAQSCSNAWVENVENSRKHFLCRLYPRWIGDALSPWKSDPMVSPYSICHALYWNLLEDFNDMKRQWQRNDLCTCSNHPKHIRKLARHLIYHYVSRIWHAYLFLGCIFFTSRCLG
jgi:hypothetical protein